MVRMLQNAIVTIPSKPLPEQRLSNHGLATIIQVEFKHNSIWYRPTLAALSRSTAYWISVSPQPERLVSYNFKIQTATKL